MCYSFPNLSPAVFVSCVDFDLYKMVEMNYWRTSFPAETTSAPEKLLTPDFFGGREGVVAEIF